MVKKYLIVFILSIVYVPFCVLAQQRPQYTQYIFNNYLLNPALSGIENYTDVKVGHRTQWAGIDNAPKTSFISAHWSLGDDYLWKNSLSLPEQGDDAMSQNYMQNYMSSPAHHGVGFMAVTDKAGAISRIDAGVTYAYHLQLSGTNNLSVGLYAGLSRIALDINAISLENTLDPALGNMDAAQLKPDVGLGVWYYGAKFFAGASMQQILPQKLSFTNNPTYTTGKSVPHMFVTTGYKLFIEESISVVPSVMLKRVEGLPISLDLNAKFSYQDRFWLGGSYRKSDSFSALVGFNIKNLINLTYAYDLTTSRLNTISNGSHEIVLGFQLNNTYKIFSKGPL